MAKPAISIVTPAYNAFTTLRWCVESIRAQSFEDWEHIIVDDGSTDNTWALLRELAEEDPRLRIIPQSNAGQGKARNVAIDLSRGCYIGLLDADDWALPGRLGLQAAFLDAHTDVDVLGGAMINISETGENLGISKLASKHDALVANIYKQTPFFTSTVMARRHFFVKLGGFGEAKRLRRGEDYDLWLRGYKRFRYHNLQIPLVFYRRRMAADWRSALYSARVIMAAIRRDRKPPSYIWYAARPLLATLCQVVLPFTFH